MMADFIDIGKGNLVNTGRLISVVVADSSPARRMMQEAKDRFSLIDASSGHKTKSVLVMDSDHVIASALSVDEVKSLLSRTEEE